MVGNVYANEDKNKAIMNNELNNYNIFALLTSTQAIRRILSVDDFDEDIAMAAVGTNMGICIEYVEDKNKITRNDYQTHY